MGSVVRNDEAAQNAPLTPEEILHAVLAFVDRGVIAIDGERRVVLCNEQAVRLLGLPEACGDGTHTLGDIEAIERQNGQIEKADAAFSLFPGDALSARAHTVLRMNSGVVLRVSSVELPKGGVLRIYSDVTELRRQADALRLATADYRSLFQNAVVGIYRSSIDGTQVRANPTLARLNGFDTEEELIQAIAIDGNRWYVDPDRRAEFQRLMAETGHVTDFVSEIITTGSRKRIWISETAWLVRDENGEPAFYEGTVVEATQRMAAEAQNAHRAMHDELTGLPNRARFRAELAQDIANATPERPVALFCLDLDHFKEVNDTLGHDAGDRLLCAVAERLRAAVRASDLVARLGGDEFALVLRGLSNASDAQRVADSILDAVRAPIDIAGRNCHPSVSIGIAFCPSDAESEQELYRCADAALYQTKAAGRNGWCFFDAELRASVTRRSEIRAALEATIAEGELRVAFEPQVAIASGEHTGFEVRVDWGSGDERLPPREVMQIAEESGQSSALGDYVLRAGLERIGRLVALGQDTGRLSVDVGAAQLKDAQFPDRLTAMATGSGVPLGRIEVELTEDVMSDRSVGQIQATLERLHQMGIAIVVDDFGSGFASLTQLKRFPVDKVKIGRALVRELGTGSDRAGMPATILTIAHGLGLQVVAEGVETQAQFDILSAHGCDFAQGELIGSPLHACPQMVDYLAARAQMRRNADAFFI
jgi:diguanylate cyclase (GGDEF)-like protein/PAS domain S-box-containing protein